MLNAAINARDAMPAGGALTIATRQRAGEDGEATWSASPADTGEGMSAEVLERAFEPFFTTKPVGKGTGLGLSQIHGFAAQSGGRAEIESAPRARARRSGSSCRAPTSRRSARAKPAKPGAAAATA